MPSKCIDDLLQIMARLRSPGSGCPWDLAQDFRSIAPFTIEEAYEVVDAIERNEFDDLADELGDLLLQIVFHSRMAEELKLFEFDDVVERICSKLIRRHPHVFSGGAEATASQVKESWEQIKERERQRDSPDSEPRLGAFFSDIALGLPALTRAVKLQARAARVGFDWEDAGKVIDKIKEEIGEIEEAIAAADQHAIGAEVGDLFFALANLARHLDIDPEQAARSANAKFIRRFAFIERSLAERGIGLDNSSLEEMDRLWDEAKRTEG